MGENQDRRRQLKRNYTVTDFYCIAQYFFWCCCCRGDNNNAIGLIMSARRVFSQTHYYFDNRRDENPNPSIEQHMYGKLVNAGKPPLCALLLVCARSDAMMHDAR